MCSMAYVSLSICQSACCEPNFIHNRLTFYVNMQCNSWPWVVSCNFTIHVARHTKLSRLAARLNESLVCVASFMFSVHAIMQTEWVSTSRWVQSPFWATLEFWVTHPEYKCTPTCSIMYDYGLTLLFNLYYQPLHERHTPNQLTKAHPLIYYTSNCVICLLFFPKLSRSNLKHILAR